MSRVKLPYHTLPYLKGVTLRSHLRYFPVRESTASLACGAQVTAFNVNSRFHRNICENSCRELDVH